MIVAAFLVDIRASAASDPGAATIDPGMAAYAAGDYPAAYLIWAAQAAEGSPEAQINAAEMLRLGRGVDADAEASRRWLLRAAERGYPVAQYMVGLRHHLGIGAAADIDAAAAWYRRAGEQGHARAALLLGQLIELGIVGERDEAAALRWYGLAAEKGETDAMLAMAALHLGGRGTRANADEAVRLLRQAADSGHPAAMLVLGLMSASGVGLMADNAIAARWLADAAAAGVPEARQRLATLRATGVAAPAAARPVGATPSSFAVDASSIVWRPERRSPDHGRKSPAEPAARRDGLPMEVAAGDSPSAPSGPIDDPKFARGDDRQGRSFLDRVLSLVERSEQARPSPSGAATIPLPPVALPPTGSAVDSGGDTRFGASGQAMQGATGTPSTTEHASEARAPRNAAARQSSPAAAQPPPGEASGGWRVRLAAYRSVDAAREGWSELQRRHADVLTGLDVAVARVEILGKGTYFRVEAGPLRSRDAADGICRQLSRRGTDCVAVMGARSS